MYTYDMVLELTIDGVLYEFYRTFKYSAQFRVGDFVYINGLEDVCIAKVTWYISRGTKPSALVELESIKTVGPAYRFTCILVADMDYCTPELPKAPGQ